MSVRRLVEHLRAAEREIQAALTLLSEVPPEDAPIIPVPLGMPLDQVRRLLVQEALAATGGNRLKAAKRLGVGRRTLINWLAKDQAQAPGPPPEGSSPERGS